MKIYINTNTESTNALVASLVSNANVELPDMFVGDYMQLETIFTNGTGGLASFYGHPDVFITVGIGDVQTREAYTKFDSNRITSEGYLGYLNLSTSGLKEVIQQEPSVDLYFEVQVSFYNQFSETYLQMPVVVNNQIIVNNRFPIPPSNILAE